MAPKNMMKCSRLLEVQCITHCVAHSIHLLLTTDSLHRNQDALDLLKKCKELVTHLHFKGEVLADEAVKLADQRVLEDLFTKIDAAKGVLDADEQVCNLEDDENDSNDESTTTTQKTQHKHTTLKQEVPSIQL